jgi:hypothetical protein
MILKAVCLGDRCFWVSCPLYDRQRDEFMISMEKGEWRKHFCFLCKDIHVRKHLLTSVFYRNKSQQTPQTPCHYSEETEDRTFDFPLLWLWQERDMGIFSLYCILQININFTKQILWVGNLSSEAHTPTWGCTLFFDKISPIPYFVFSLNSFSVSDKNLETLCRGLLSLNQNENRELKLHHIVQLLHHKGSDWKVNRKLQIVKN